MKYVTKHFYMKKLIRESSQVFNVYGSGILLPPASTLPEANEQTSAKAMFLNFILILQSFDL